MKSRVLLLALCVCTVALAEDILLHQQPHDIQHRPIDSLDAPIPVDDLPPPQEHDHPFLLLGILAFLGASQFALHWWKKKYQKSFKNFSLAGLFLVPLAMSLNMFYWRMVVIWTMFTSITAYLLKQASASPVPKGVPRKVYTWFMNIHRLCGGLAVVGYALMVMQFLVPFPLMDTGILLLFYGLYFGVLLRDCAEIASDRIASHMGFYSKDGIPSRQAQKHVCSICGGKVKDKDANGIDQNVAAMTTEDDDPNSLSFLNAPVEETFKLECGHVYHEFCLRGWVIIGKKDTCACCMEKVCLKQVFGSIPWQRHSLAWGQVLDTVRYFVVWNPIILFGLGLFIRVFHRD
jgi:RING finger protein 121